MHVSCSYCCTVAAIYTHRHSSMPIRTCIVFLDRVQNSHIHAVRAPKSLWVFSAWICKFCTWYRKTIQVLIYQNLHIHAVRAKILYSNQRTWQHVQIGTLSTDLDMVRVPTSRYMYQELRIRMTQIGAGFAGSGTCHLKSTYCFCAHMHEIMKYLIYVDFRS